MAARKTAAELRAARLAKFETQTMLARMGRAFELLGFATMLDRMGLLTGEAAETCVAIDAALPLFAAHDESWSLWNARSSVAAVLMARGI